MIDTNVWVSALINPAGAPASVVEAWRRSRLRLVTSPPLVAEVFDVLGRIRIRRRSGLAPDDVATVLRVMVAASDVVLPVGELRVCRDPDDDILIETAVIGQADLLVTRDDDLKDDREVVAFLQRAGVEVVSVSNLLERMSP